MATTPTRARSYAELAQALAQLDDRARPGRTFDLLARMLDRTDAELQDRTGLSRQTINAKRSGGSRVSAKDLWPLAEAVEVEAQVLLLPPSEAACWLAEHRANMLDGAGRGNGHRQHNGDGRSLEQKGGRLCSVRQHDIWSCKLAGLALAA